MTQLILAINPGSTSTKIAVFDGQNEIFTDTLRHSNEELEGYLYVVDQFDFRKNTIIDAIKKRGIALKDIKIVVGRGGLMRPISSGVYRVNDAMIEDLKGFRFGEHASNLGGLIAADLAKEIPGCEAYIADPVVVDELEDIARVTGHPLFKKISIFHALNQKAVAKRFSQSQGKPYEELNLIVVHLGGGVSVGAHKGGKVVDVNNALNGEGPFSPERTGTVPALQLAELCFLGNYTFDQIRKIIAGAGGVVAHLGTNSFIEVQERVGKGDKEAKLIFDAFAYNIAKEIASKAVIFKGQVDSIILTGGIAYSKELTKDIEEMVSFIAPVTVIPGEDEMSALAMNGYGVLTGIEKVKEY